MSHPLRATLVASLALAPAAAPAATEFPGILMEFAETDGGVTATLSGIAQLPDPIGSGPVLGPPRFTPNEGIIVGYEDDDGDGGPPVNGIRVEGDDDLGPLGPELFAFRVSGDFGFGTGGEMLFSTWTGDPFALGEDPDEPGEGIFGIAAAEVFSRNDIGFGYSATGFLEGASFASLGVTPGSSFGFRIIEGDQIFAARAAEPPPPELTVRFTRAEPPGVIPLPGALPLLLGGLGLMGLMARRRRG